MSNYLQNDITELKSISSEEFEQVIFEKKLSDANKIEIRDLKVIDSLFIEGWSIEKTLEIINCSFNELVYFESGKFQNVIFENCTFNFLTTKNPEISGILDIKWSSFKHLTFHGGRFNKIQASFSAIDELDIWRGIIEDLVIGYWKGGDKIKKLSILSNNGEYGRIQIKGYTIEALFINGIIDGKRILLEDVNCGILTLSEISNNGSGSLKLIGINPIKERESIFSIVNSYLGKSEFYRCDFKGFSEVNIRDSYLLDCIFTNVTWMTKISTNFPPEYQARDTLKPVDPFQAREAYRQLKHVLAKHGDSINEAVFYSKEMNVYWESLTWKKFEDKIILGSSKLFSNFGLSFLLPLIWMFIFHSVLFFMMIYFFNYKSLEINIQYHNWEAFKIGVGEYFKLIIPLHRIEGFHGTIVLIDILMRISSSYFIYCLIRASRKFIR